MAGRLSEMQVAWGHSQLKPHTSAMVAEYIELFTATSAGAGKHIRELTMAGWKQDNPIHSEQAACAWAALALVGKRNIITTNQAKLNKAVESGIRWVNAGLTLSPAKEAARFFKRGWMGMCEYACPACIVGCVGKGGQGRMPTHKVVRSGRTIALAYDYERFATLTAREIRNLGQDADYRGLSLGFRTNIASDLPWLAGDLRRRVCPEPNVRFYDYTKDPDAMYLDDGVARALSRTGDGDTFVVSAALHDGLPVAVVFDVKKHELPTHWHGAVVIDGDLHDLWFLQLARNAKTVVGLSLKGTRHERAVSRARGFAVDPSSGHAAYAGNHTK